METPIDDLFDVIRSKKYQRLEVLFDAVFENIDMERVAYALGVSNYQNDVLPEFYHGDISEFTERKLLKRAREVLSRLKIVFQRGNFDYRPQFVEVVLAAQPANSIHHYIDMYGAYSYSATRLEQLHLIYRALVPGHKAHIYVPDATMSFVKVKGLGVKMELTHYLTLLYPDVFSVVRADSNYQSQILIIKKLPSLGEIHIPLKEDSHKREEAVFSPFTFEFSEI